MNYCSLCGKDHHPQDLERCRQNLSTAVGMETRIALQADQQVRELRERVAGELRKRIARLEAACTEAFNLIDGCPCLIDSPEEWKRQVRAQLIEALKK